MARRYTYSRSVDLGEGIETFTAVEFDSFDEAQKTVEKAIYDRKLQADQKSKMSANVARGPQNPPVNTATAGSTPSGTQ